ncbi:related to amidase [Ustilago trichophora]|uniref:Related to amidase n=1 Tax=Ustilago trichophora TaxID=86804 RepID=A0A5C3EJ34_9BASI|nr:related to amidase [Ustilago trichophora]
MPDSKIARAEFRNPCPDLKNPAAKTVVDSLLSTVSKASERFGEPTAEDYEIANLTLHDIQQRLIHEEDLTVPRVVEARIRLTIKASLDTHCLTAFPYDKALEQARYYQKDVIKIGDNDNVEQILDAFPLLGLVFSVKDCIHVEGFPTTLGCSLRAGHNEVATAKLVQRIMDGGAIMIAKTTAPQLMMSNTTQSPLWGTTRSAIQSAEAQGEEFQVGGSSGGEAALVKMGGSQLGIGTDMGGSVRQPACLNELFGYKFISKPNNFRWKLPQDFMTGLPHTTVPATAPGLLARDIHTLKLVGDHLHGSLYANMAELTDSDYQDVYEEWEMPVPEDLGNNPRIVYTTQQSSPEVHQLVHWLLEKLQKHNDLARPTQCQELGDIDVKAWGETWMEHAKEHGFNDARAMLADDPLIKRTMFDESRLSTNDADKASWKPDSDKLARLKAEFVKQAKIKVGDDDSKTSEKDDEDESDDDDEDEEQEDDKGGKDKGPENVILVTPTYTLGGPVQQSTFVQLDDAGESEIWCQIFNLVDWPAISIPLNHLPVKARQEFHDKALASPEWAKHLPGKVKADPIDNQAKERLPSLSLQLATLPGNQHALLDYALRLSRLKTH